MRSENRILDVIGLGGTLQFHLLIAKFQLRYLADSQALISLSKIGGRLVMLGDFPFLNEPMRKFPYPMH